jgi:hypothetical protein
MPISPIDQRAFGGGFNGCVSVTSDEEDRHQLVAGGEGTTSGTCRTGITDATRRYSVI